MHGQTNGNRRLRGGARTTDWVARDDVRAKIRSTVKRLLAKYGYPPGA